jgi:hypothetical protein
VGKVFSLPLSGPGAPPTGGAARATPPRSAGRTPRP